MADEDKSAIDILSEGSLSDQLGDEPAEGEEKVEPKVDPAIEELRTKLEKQDALLLEQQMELRTTRGYLKAIGERSNEKTEKEEPAEEAVDYEAVTKDIETRGAKALHEFMAKEIGKEVAKALKAVDGKISTTRQQDQSQQRYRSAMQSEAREMFDAHPDLKTEGSDFQKEVNKACAEILSERLGRPLSDDGSDVRYYQPGDLKSGIARVLANRKDEAKPSNGSSLREITRRVPSSDSLGDKNPGAKTNPKTIADTDWPEKEKIAAKNVFRKLKELNPGMKEENFIKYASEAQQDANS